jgi:two-component system CheB/CheR fusion protein
MSVSIGAELQTRAFELNGTPQIVVDQERRLILANRRARDLFGLAQEVMGKPLHDLQLAQRPIDLGSAIDRAGPDAPVVVHAAGWERGGETGYWDITVTTLTGDAPVGTLIAFADVTAHHEMQEELQRVGRELQRAYGELRSTVEQLETTNEELQSANEELETMNEELRSANDELETMNTELRQSSSNLSEATLVFASVLANLRTGVVVTDADLRVEIWNAEAENLWGLTADDVLGQDLLSLSIGLPVADVREPAQAILAGRSAQEARVVHATDRSGRAVTCAVTMVPLARDATVTGLIILMNAQDAPPPA